MLEATLAGAKLLVMVARWVDDKGSKGKKHRWEAEINVALWSGAASASMLTQDSTVYDSRGLLKRQTQKFASRDVNLLVINGVR